MDFKNELITKLKESGLTDSTINLYVRNLEILNNKKELKNLKFLSNINNIIEILDTKKENTQRQYLISVVSALKLYNDRLSAKLYDKYYKMMIDLSKQLKENNPNEKTLKESTNWIDWDDVLKVWNVLKIKTEFKNKKVLDEQEYNLLLYFTLLSFYVLLYPRRNEYIYLNVVKKYDNSLSNDKNYLSLDTKELILNKFKTVKTEGQKVIEYNDELDKIIKKYLKYHPKINGKITKMTNTPFFAYYDGCPFKTINAITIILNKIFYPLKVSSSMLRHSFLSSKFGDELKKRKEISQLMSHSIGMQDAYIKE